MVTDPERYPVGPMPTAAPADPAARVALIASIERAPAVIRELVAPLDAAALETPYRNGGWTIRQVVHHVPESHMNAYIRMKLALTEDNPAIKTYEEAFWSELPDVRLVPVTVSLDLLDALHRRWVTLLRALTSPQLHRTFSHPQWGSVTIDAAIAMYEWHGRHHAGHIRNALGRMARA